MRIVLEHVTRRYGDRAVVDGISQEILSRELLVLLGPSGSGKSTLLAAIAGLLPIQAGRILLGDQLANDPAIRLPPARRSIGMVFQELALWPHMTVAQHLRFVAPDANPDETLRALEIPHLAAALPQTLSGGEAQRLAIARALITRPRILLLDEPLGPLDRRLKERLLDLIRKMHTDFGTTTVYVTHDYEEAFRVADRVGVLVAGRLQQVAPPSEIYQRPVTSATAEVSGPVSWLGCRLEGGKARTQLGEHVVTAGSPNAEGRILLRPETVTMRPTEDKVAAKVESCFASGTEWTVRAKIGDDVLEGRCAHPVEVGSRVQVQLPDEVWVL